tara:strand:- start:69 stop:248 length:180 start_codon:yes stop_codon:yes gene_type:complete
MEAMKPRIEDENSVRQNIYKKQDQPILVRSSVLELLGIPKEEILKLDESVFFTEEKDKQ